MHKISANRAINKRIHKKYVLLCRALENMTVENSQEVFIWQKSTKKCIIPRKVKTTTEFKNIFKTDRARFNYNSIDYISIGDVRSEKELDNAISVTEGGYLTRVIAEIKSMEGINNIDNIL